MSDKEYKNLLGIKDHLASKVMGQDEAIDKISVTIQRNRIGIRRKIINANIMYQNTTSLVISLRPFKKLPSPSLFISKYK